MSGPMIKLTEHRLKEFRANLDTLREWEHTISTDDIEYRDGNAVGLLAWASLELGSYLDELELRFLDNMAREYSRFGPG